MDERNWSGTHRYGATRILEPRSVDELSEMITGSGPVRALGTRHSFTDLPDSEGSLVTVLRIPPEPVLDEVAATVTVGAGVRYGELADWLEQRGWALHNLGSLPHISVGGATATATHGSGDGNGVLSSALRALEFVDALGELRRLDARHSDFPALAVGLGAFGVLTRVTLAVQPSFRVRQDVYRDLSWEALLEHLPEVTGAGYSVSVFTRWAEPRIGQVWVKTRVDDDAQAVPDTLLDGARATESAGALAAEIADNLTEQGGAPGPWNQRLPHFRFDATPSSGDEIQSEYFVDPADAAAAISALRPLAERIAPILHVSEFRTAAADELWLSGAYRRGLFAIHFTWHNDPRAVRALLPEVEARLAPFAARPHWGKLHLFDAERIGAVVPRRDDARRVFEGWDPEGRFANAHLRRLGLRDEPEA